MKQLMREYWFYLIWSLGMVGVGMGMTVEYGIKVGFLAYGLAFLMLSPVLFEIYERVKSKQGTRR